MTEKSSFDTEHQNENLNSKITAALERISNALRVLLWNESKENSLSPIQNQILIFLLFHREEYCTVSYLAEEFNITKATVSDSIKVLENKALVSKKENLSDLRSQIILLTEKGKNIAEKASRFVSGLEYSFEHLTENQKETVFKSLTDVIYNLHQQNIISLQRMCFSCNNYSNVNGEHYCKLLDRNLQDSEIRVDCGDFEMVN